ncbi:MAG: hypothetical protein NT157_03635, partial [Candidatus Micrarchaeota archaeon]|nr:hypothetical protein [Candidatus Micrarchaeota archaeon]
MLRIRLSLVLVLVLLSIQLSFPAGNCPAAFNCEDCAWPGQCAWCGPLQACMSLANCLSDPTCGPSNHCISDPEECSGPPPNTPPTVGIVSILPSPVLVGEDFNFHAIVSDANGDACTVTYKVWDGGSSEASPDGAGTAVCTGSSWITGKTCTVMIVAGVVELPTPVTCKLYADDGHGGTASRSATATLQCPSGETDCSNLCKNLQTDPDNCGTCGNDCGEGTCTAGVCSCS